MQIPFAIAGEPAQFRRNAKTGRASLHIGDDVITLQSPYRLGTHFSVKTTRTWQRRVREHDVAIALQRPRMLGGVRAMTYTVTVDGQVVATVSGR